MFGVNLLVLWKLSLLDLRILFYCAPPMEKLCNQLFPLSHLSHYTHRPALQGSANFLRGDQLVDANEKLQLYVTLFDFSSEDCKLRSERAYFACTSDKVVEENMKGCYDVFVDGNSIRTWRRDLLSVIKPTKADNIRLAELKKLLVFHWESSLEEVHAAFVEYFASLNDRIIHGLVECSQGTWKDVDGDFEEEVHMLRDSEEITSGDVSNMGLMPHNGDMAFVQELAAHFDLDVVFVSEPAGCCPIF